MKRTKRRKEKERLKGRRYSKKRIAQYKIIRRKHDKIKMILNKTREVRLKWKKLHRGETYNTKFLAAIYQ